MKGLKKLAERLLIALAGLVLISLAWAQPAPPGGMPLPGMDSGASETVTATTTSTATAPATETMAPTSTPATNDEQAQIEVINQKLIALESKLAQKTEVPQSSSSGYFSFLLVLDLLIIAALAYMFLKGQNKTQNPESPRPMTGGSLIPDKIKNYVRMNLQRGYAENLIRQQLAGQGWSADKINQIFEEVQHGL